MSTTPTTAPQAAILAAARAGDQDAFAALVTPHQPALHVHCYRMLGSIDDADDAVQETLLLAWRGLDGYRQQAPLIHWLYRIATTTSLKMIRTRSRRPATVTEVAHLQPYPDRLLDQLTAPAADPAWHAERRESVALAFIAALQLLPARQRAVLILRDVLTWTAAEVADLLQLSVPAVNSALQRARANLPTDPPPPHDLSGDDELLLDRFMDAWRRCDIPALAAILRDDVRLAMPPEAIQFLGRDAVVEFFATVPAGGRLDTIVLTPTRANGHAALAAYLPDRTGTCRGYGIMVFTMAGGQIHTITGFPSPGLFDRFALPSDRADPSDR